MKTRAAAGWLAVLLATGMSSLWAYWGIIENFHEGWYSTSLAANLGMMFFQYLSPSIVFVLLTVAAIRWPYVGGMLLLATGLAARFLLFKGMGSTATVMILVPMALLAVLFTFGRPQPLKWAYRVAIGLPIFTLIVAGIQPFWMEVTRETTVELQSQVMNGLTWAPAGPGWPDRGVTWQQAEEICAHLSSNGTQVMTTPQNIWRLPTVNEAVTSMTLHRLNAGGKWDPDKLHATYRITPDKEAPLWNPNSMVIYWWTSSEAPQDRAFIVVYNGSVEPREKKSRWDYMAFRAVKSGP